MVEPLGAVSEEVAFRKVEGVGRRHLDRSLVQVLIYIDAMTDPTPGSN